MQWAWLIGVATVANNCFLCLLAVLNDLKHTEASFLANFDRSLLMSCYKLGLTECNNTKLEIRLGDNIATV